MEWIINNKEWIFSGVGVAIVGFLGNKLFGKNRETKESNVGNTQSQQQTVNIYNGITSSSNNPVIKNQADIKTAIHILFIDDEKFDHVDVLKNAGWVNTKRIKDVKRIDCPEVLTANVIFVDINGVGCSLYPKEQGLGVAAKIKEIYPNKYVVVYSAQPQQLNSLLGQVDAILPKDADPYQYMNILENFSSK